MKNLSPVDERVLPDSGRPCRSPQQSNYSSCLTFDTWANNAFFSSPNLIFLIFLYSWRVHTTLRKILDTMDDKPQRNNLSKLGTLKYEFPQLRHSALRFIINLSIYIHILSSFPSQFINLTFVYM